MDIDKLRKMSAVELAKYLNNLQYDKKFCIKCDSPAHKVIRLYDRDKETHKSICGICDECYKRLLDFLKIGV